jgi:flavodoxin
MSILHDIDKLPETVPSEQLQQHFQNAVNQYENVTIDLDTFLYVIFELADKQWHTYELAADAIRAKLDSIIGSILSGALSLEIIEQASFIIGSLGLVKSYEILKALHKDKKLATSIRIEIEKAINEFGDSVADVY